VDCAADSFYKDRKYTIRDKPTPLGSDKYVDFILELAEQYSILVIEDPLSSDDFDNWQRLVKQLGDHIYIIADDLIGGSKKRLEKAISLNACNVISIKLNQVATVTEMFSLIATAKKAGIKIMVSQRMNETNDDFIADLAVGIQADFVKFGSPYRGERIAKYNRLLQIYSELTKSA
jgi:enolase